MRAANVPSAMGGAVIALALLWSCASALPPLDSAAAADRYRAELARNPRGDEVRELRRALERAEFESARRAHTILAYRRFLSEFPASPYTAEVRTRLESLRWAEAEAIGSEAALTGFLADEPGGAHAAEAWDKLAAVRLEAAVQSRDVARLRAWLAGNPHAAGRQRALAALDEAQFAAARDGSGSARNEALRAYLSDFAAGEHRAEAQQLLLDGEVAEAALLEDEARLASLSRAGAEQSAPAARDEARLQRAAARLDGDALTELRQRGAAGDRAAELAARVRRADPALVQAAQALFLPQPTGDELPDEGAARVRALHQWALALDGNRLPLLLAELSSPRAYVAVGALRAAAELAAGLPPIEARARAERLLASLRPKAHSAPLLVAVSLLEEAAGHRAEALAQARAAVASDARSLVAGLRAAALEARLGEASVALLAAQALVSQASALSELHGELARGSGERGPDLVAVLELCAAAGAAREAERLLLQEQLSAEPGALQARERAAQLAARLEGRVDEAGRSARPREPAGACARLRDQEAAQRADAVQSRRRAAERLALGGPVVISALQRAQRRDPDEQVQRIVSQALQQQPARASAAAPR